MYYGSYDVKNGITLYQPFHTFFDAGLFYIEPHSHEVVAMGALRSIHNDVAASLLTFSEQKHVTTVCDPAFFPPDDLLAVQKDYCLKQAAKRATDYQNRPLYCPRCGCRYVNEARFQSHKNRCSVSVVSPARAFTPPRSASADTLSAASTSIPTPVSSFDLSRLTAAVNEIHETHTQDKNDSDEGGSEDAAAPSSRQCVCFGKPGCHCIKGEGKQCKCLCCRCHFAGLCLP
jgi:hypothetical protein